MGEQVAEGEALALTVRVRFQEPLKPYTTRDVKRLLREIASLNAGVAPAT
jgi:hypothetical protein